MVGLNAGFILAGKLVGGVRSGGLASGMRVVVETVWNVWMRFVVSSELAWITVVLFSLSGSSVCVGLCGASSRERREVFESDGIAYAGGSQEGVRA